MVNVMPPVATVVPCEPVGATQAPLVTVVHMLPPDHVDAPLIVTLSVPARLPPLKARVGAAMGVPVEKFAVPLLIVSGPMLVTAAGVRKLAVPPLTVVPPVTL